MFEVVGKCFPTIPNLASIFPGSIYRLRKLFKLDRDSFEKFVVCPECLKLYTDDKIFDRFGKPIQCDNQVLVQNGQVKVCNSRILKKVHLSGNKVKYRPLKTFCYNSIVSSLETLIQKRPEFLNKSMQWKDRQVESDYLIDIYDGRVWKKLFGEGGVMKNENGVISFGFMLNVDWFQPYERRPNVSVGAMYLAILNLPLEIRYKKENLIVLGILPAFAKEPSSLNSFLEPFVHELKRLWGEGFPIRTNSEYAKEGKIQIKGALVCCSSDLPANRKVCGFLGHAAVYGCSKCCKQFEYKNTGQLNVKGQEIKRPDYSGFDKRNWTERNIQNHKTIAQRLHSCTTKSEREKMEKENGLRWVPFLNLTYFDPIQFCAIDPMHNLFLGSAKKMFATWIDRGILGNEELENISTKMTLVSTPSGMGRLPKKISSCWGKFTAEEWLIWTLYYSLFVLQDVLPEVHLKIWHTFVSACRIACAPILTTTEIEKLKRMFLKFGTEFENEYGEMSTYPNLHLHGHLNECLLDYGPVYNFWCFAFERYNGTIADIHVNHIAIEIQLMRTITSHSFISNLQFSTPSIHADTFQPTCESLINTGSSEFPSVTNSFILYECTHNLPSSLNNAISDSLVHPKGPGKLRAISSVEAILQMYQALYPNSSLDNNDVPLTYHEYGSVVIGRELFGSRINKRTSNNSLVMASWSDEDGNVCFDNLLNVRPGTVKFFMKHSITIENTKVDHILAVVSWFRKPTELQNLREYKNPVTAWAKQRVQYGPASYIPVQRIKSKFVFMYINENVLVTCPLVRKF